MIHYHGTPITPRSELLKLAGKHFCVPFSSPNDAAICQQIGQSIMFDNGAFTAFTKGKSFDRKGYYEWLAPRIGHPHWAVIPDVIDGTVEEQIAEIQTWPFGKHLGMPVWHIGLPIEWLVQLADNWPRICFGSSGKFWKVGSSEWRRRIDEAFNALAIRGPLPWVHMLRGLNQSNGRWPFASADSTNVARNHFCRPETIDAMATRIDAIQCPVHWTFSKHSRNY